MKRKFIWHCPGLQPVHAYTASEARALFKGQLRAIEKLSFRPRRINRLPVGAAIVCDGPAPEETGGTDGSRLA